MLPLLAAAAAAGANSSCSLPISTNQVVKNARPVEISGWGVAESSEWQDRLELAALARIMYIYGFGSDLAAQCVMARLRDEPDTMLMNEWGLFFEEATASSLVKVRFGDGTPPEGLLVAADGSVAPSKPDVVNIGCVPVGRAIFEARPDVFSIIHAHPHAVMAVASTEAGLLPLSQASPTPRPPSSSTARAPSLRQTPSRDLHTNARTARAAQHTSALPCCRPGPEREKEKASPRTIGRYKYDFSYGSDFEDAIAAQFAAGKRAIMLDHHGLYAVGTSARDAWFVTFHLHQACEVQLRAQSTGQALVMPSQEELQRQYADMISSPDYAYDGSREWAGCVRKLNRELPGYDV
ncbi:hypothetical protein EMIHUDRAFT_461189 [Emiliania huxleyi CCMP1516]|uniref:Class II aldolase/adducin N-terminal domain-containing protein n=2 Tax=Emiliania huxleyi TaxID=2903 RepID=A0A0D3JHI1_EMIH1|nr:hypothetical protein EMIHUDRAFT_461189 [Emiliania huxleyi CCMP1516]EOD22966.1 hypothetical protein EMIHUDRAFT_461189 [Emiliania huxleyi CCMP1516]|eukprot:XP_005775395.1 hypothetical protein EMIHUDRAFT_461189 [Emiliania huxleyi CCMP1516]